jgi:TonB-linked SusC/RagA family outer membrane protein
MVNFLINQKNDLKKIFSVMKYALLFMFISILSVTAESYAQQAKVSVNIQNGSIYDIVSAIEKQTDFMFFYKSDDISSDLRVSVRATKRTVPEVLDEVTKDTDLSYNISNKVILIAKTTNLSFQQVPRKITGSVVDEKGEPAIGASIVVKGTTTGVITDVDGKFGLEVPTNAVLQVSYIGYITQEIVVGSQSSLNITLVEDNLMLEEVVVIGYGTIKKKDLTGAVAQFKTEKFEKESQGTVQALLRNNLAGLNIGIATTAQGGGSIQVRGQRSLKAGNDPLIVVDGIIFAGDLSEINPLDIEQIDVLKDASSAAVYGAKSANGVLLITTKTGKTKKPVIRFNASIGAVTLGPAARKVYDAAGFLKYREDLYASKNNFVNPGQFAKPTADNLSKYGMSMDQWLNFTPGMSGDPEDIWLRRLNLTELERSNYFAGKTYDWWDASLHTGLRQDYNVSLSGKSDMFNYYWSLGYMDNESLTVGDEFAAYRSNLKLDAKVTNWLNVGANVNFQNRIENAMAVDVTSQILRNSPYSLPVDDDGNMIKYPTGDQATSINSAYDFQYTKKDNVLNVLNTTIYAKIQLPFNISYSFNFSPRFAWRHNLNHQSSQNPHWSDNGVVQRQSTRQYNWMIDNVLTWDQTFVDKHHFTVTLMQGAEDNKHWSETMIGKDFTPTDALGYHYINIANMTKSSISSTDEHSTGDALMARLNYSYDSRYMLTASIRRDGYSAFGISNPRATFPALALAWNFTKESFFNWQPMSMGKVRLSWGQNGNRSIGIYQAFSTLTTGSGKYPYINSNGTVTEISQLWTNRMANHDLKWESTASWNVGLDVGFLNNRINATIDAYHMPTTDLLMDQSVPVITGFDNVIANLGEVQNKGIELSVNSINMQRSNFEWSSGFTFSMNRNKIAHLYYEYENVTDAAGNVIGRKERDDISNLWFVGHDINSIWTYNVLGIWQLGEEEEAAKYALFPGDRKVKDVSAGSTDPDFKFNNDDKEFLGYTTPRYRLSLRNEFTIFKNWSVSLSMYAYLGQKTASITPGNRNDLGSQFPERLNSYRKKYWTPDNPTNKYARLFSVDPQNVDPPFILDKSFLRLDNFAVSYNVPETVLRKLQLQGLQIYGSIRNIAVWSPGWIYGDPETGVAASPRYFTIGVNFTL